MQELDMSPWGDLRTEWDTLSVSRRGDVTIIAPSGALNPGAIEQLAPLVRNAAAWGADVVLDFCGVESLESRAIDLIGCVAADVQRREGRWVVAAIDAAGDPVRFNAAASLSAKLTTCCCVDEAVELLREPSLPGGDGFAEAA